MFNKCPEEANKKLMFVDCAVSECPYCGVCMNDPDHPECLQASPFQWRAVLPKARSELSKYRDYIVSRVKAKINISK